MFTYSLSDQIIPRLSEYSHANVTSYPHSGLDVRIIKSCFENRIGEEKKNVKTEDKINLFEGSRERERSTQNYCFQKIIIDGALGK